MSQNPNLHQSREAEAALRAQLKVATAGLSAGKDHGDASLLAPAMPQGYNGFGYHCGVRPISDDDRPVQISNEMCLSPPTTAVSAAPFHAVLSGGVTVSARGSE